MTEQYMPTTEQVRLDYVMAYSEKESSQIVAERDFDRWLAKRDAEVAAKALGEAASAWQVSGWAHDLPEKGAERAQVILHMAQAATEMLRLRAAEYRKGQGND